MRFWSGYQTVGVSLICRSNALWLTFFFFFKQIKAHAIITFHNEETIFSVVFNTILAQYKLKCGQDACLIYQKQIKSGFERVLKLFLS